MNIVLLGSGNVATHLSKALDHARHNILQIWSREKAHAKTLADEFGVPYTDTLDDLDRNADLYIISVVDDAISELIGRLAALDDVPDGTFVHTSGSTSIDVFRESFANYGVFYPLQTFSKTKEVDFRDTPVLLEASDIFQLDLLKKIAFSISDRVEVATSAQRKSLHVAAVFACNFTNHLYSIAQQLLEDNDLDFDLIRPLIKETADKIQIHSPMEVQTGPAIRGDLSILKDHMKFLDDSKEWQEIYKLLSDRLVALSTQK